MTYDTLVEVNKGNKISRKLQFMLKHSRLSTKIYKTVCKLIWALSGLSQNFVGSFHGEHSSQSRWVYLGKLRAVHTKCSRTSAWVPAQNGTVFTPWVSEIRLRT